MERTECIGRGAISRSPSVATRSQQLGGSRSLGEVNESSWDWAGSEKEFRRAIELHPGAVDCGCYAGFLAAMGASQKLLKWHIAL